LEDREFPLLVANWRNELARFSNTFFRPWHKSSQPPYLSDERTAECSTAGSLREISVVAGAEVAGAGVASAEAAGAGVASAEVTGAGCDTGAGAEAESECGCGAGGFADADSSND
jgi:hypothetical protein